MNFNPVKYIKKYKALASDNWNGKIVECLLKVSRKKNCEKLVGLKLLYYYAVMPSFTGESTVSPLSLTL